MNKKGLRVRVLIGTAVAALLPCLTQASAPSDTAIGEIDAILKFCVKTNPWLEENARSWQVVLTGKAAPGARASAQYKQGYDLVSEALENANRAQVSAACIAGLAPPESHEARDGHGHEHEHEPEHGRR
jgi:hypothetical protein